MRTDVKIWLHGILAAFVGGFFGAIDSSIVLSGIAPETFNFDEGLHKMLLGVGIFALLSGAKTAAAYLKESPVPASWNGVDRRGDTSPKE